MFDCSLIIFAREPKDGKTKTRLLKHIPSEDVTGLYKTLVKKVVGIAGGAKCKNKFIYYTGSTPPLPFLGQFAKRFKLHRQKGKDLGKRMHQAFLNSKRLGFNRTIIIGTDCISLTSEDISKAAEKLNNYDLVLGPSKDGGYYLIGLKNPEEKLFQDIPWSTPKVLTLTLKRAKELNKKVYLLQEKIDIDTIDDVLLFFPKVRRKNV